MDNSMIGIKIADGTYFPILEEEAVGRKKLVLTTVNDDQGSVQIDLYKGEGQQLQDALYVGSLVIEDIMPAMKGEPEIELVIGVDDDGNLNAEAGDTATSERQSLSVSLESLDDGDFTTPNFELDEDGFGDIPALEEDEPAFNDESVFEDEPEFGDVPAFDDEPVLDNESSFEEESGFSEDLAEYPEESRRKRGPLALIILIILILAILGLGALLIIRGMNSDTVPPLEADSSPAVTEPEPAPPVEPEPVVAEAEPEPEPAAAEPEPELDVPATVQEEVSYGDVPPAGRGGGVWYRLKWGDTLWDLSNSFYRTPWLYGLIAVENEIKNPDIIYAGTDILIPEN